MANYNHMNPILGSSTLKLKMSGYIEESLNPVKGTSLYEDLFYKEDIPQIDPKTGKRWTKTFRVSKPQGVGGAYAAYTEENWKGAQQGGYLGFYVPNEQEYTIGTRFNYASMGRTFQDKINDTDDFYEAVKQAAWGEHIREQQLEEIKSEIFKWAIKTYAGEKATEDEVTATDVLTWDGLATLAESVETWEVDVQDNRTKAGDSFVNAVKAVSGTASGATALNDLNVIDFQAFADAQKAFETAGMRTYRWTMPRFSIAGVSGKNYESSNINADEIRLTAPAMKDLFTKHHKNQDDSLPVFVSKEGYKQLWDDPTFRELVEVSGFQHETGLSGRFDRFIRKNKAVDVQGLLIINMEQDYIHGANASEGVDFGASVNASGVRLDSALIATPGYNFITTSSAFGTRTTVKTMEQTDMIDRMGFHEFVYTMFPWAVQINTPSAFNLLVHASK